jgi:hypothetical protein
MLYSSGPDKPFDDSKKAQTHEGIPQNTSNGLSDEIYIEKT